MISRLRKVIKDLYRGGAPSIQDVVDLKNDLGIKRVVSLDQEAGEKIDRICKILGIEHIMLPIDIAHLKATLLNFLKYNLKDLLTEKPTFIHCAAGKDRTGLAIALFKCRYLGMEPSKALSEAKSLGFGVGADPHMIKLFEKLIMSCQNKQDKNEMAEDIVSLEREYISDNRDSFLDEGHQGSFAPYLSKTRQDPMDALYVYINDQSPTRENYQAYKTEKLNRNDPLEEDIIPQVGIFNNDSGARGFGPTENYSGFFYD